MDLNAVLEQKRRLDRCADELHGVKRRLRSHRENLSNVWASSEILGIQDVLERMDLKSERLMEDMDSVGHAMVKACLELLEEEE